MMRLERWEKNEKQVIAPKTLFSAVILLYDFEIILMKRLRLLVEQ